MSCGNRFQCGLTKPSRFQFKPDKPSNPELHNENQQRLNDLLKAREDIDKQFFSANSNSKSTDTITQYTPQNNNNTNSTYTPWTTDTLNDTFTPWKTPSATDYQSKAK